VETDIMDMNFTAANGAPNIVPFGTRMVGPILLKYGAAAQKEYYLLGIISANTLWCQGYSEPGAGSNLALLQM
jgi:alkylation response protein AidB-like acyl-CoA dehydrogenase